MAVRLERVPDPGDSFEFWRVQSLSVPNQRPGTEIQYEGRAHPTAHRGTGRQRVAQLTAVFDPDRHGELADLLDLLKRADEAADSRLRLYPEVAGDPRLNEPYNVVCRNWPLSHRPAGVIEVSLELREVN